MFIRCKTLLSYFHLYFYLQRQTLNVGTTTACYFASLYGQSSLILARKASEYHQRAFVGKVNANVARDDDYYEETEDSIQNATKFVDDVFSLNVR